MSEQYDPFPNPEQVLQDGDVLLFSRSTSIFNWIIKVKTWSRFTHCEVIQFDGDTLKTVASRDGVGVGWYPPEWRGLAMVLRPVQFPNVKGRTFNTKLARAWFAKVKGQGYDWLGLLNFAYARVVGADNTKQFCSEFCTRYLRAGGFNLFRTQDADTVSPRDFAYSDQLDVVFEAPAEAQKEAGKK